MQQLKLLIIPLLAFIVGGTMLCDARVKARRAEMVEADPGPITCDELIAQGPPDNRHVRVTDCWFAEEYVRETYSDRDEWAYVLVPVYPASVDAPCTGESVRLVGRILVHNEDELRDFISSQDKGATGCIWDDLRGARTYHLLLLGSYPRLAERAYRIIELNGEIPTRAAARREALIAVAVLAGGLLFAAWIVSGHFKTRRRDRNREWFADPRYEGFIDEHAAEAQLGHLEQPSDIMTTLRTWAFILSLISVPAAGFFYLGEKLAVIPAPIGGMAGGISLVAFLASTAFFLWSGRYFREQAYEWREYGQLPRAARKYFDRQTAILVKQGFTHLGDLRVTESMRASVRLLLSSDQTCLVSLESVLHMRAYNLMSIADDGVLLHLVSVDLERKRDTPLPTRCEWIQTDNIGLAYTQHRKLVARYLEFHPMATECLLIDPEYAIGVMDYAHRISGWSLLERGITRNRLPPLPRANQLTRIVDRRKTFAWQARPSGVIFPPGVIAAVRRARAAVERPFNEGEDARAEVLARASSSGMSRN